jgi:hypothetical protein
MISDFEKNLYIVIVDTDAKSWQNYGNGNYVSDVNKIVYEDFIKSLAFFCTTYLSMDRNNILTVLSHDHINSNIIQPSTFYLSLNCPMDSNPVISSTSFHNNIQERIINNLIKVIRMSTAPTSYRNSENDDLTSNGFTKCLSKSLCSK